MSLQRRLSSLEQQANEYIEKRPKVKSDDITIIQMTNDDVQQLIDSDITINPNEQKSDHIQYDLSLLSDEMLNRLEQYLNKQKGRDRHEVCNKGY